jgi:hypothetical protein
VAAGASHAQAVKEASAVSQAQGGSGKIASIPHFVKVDFAFATRNVLHVMAVIMAVAAVVAFVGLQRGVQEDVAGPGADPAVGTSSEAGLA